ncbi:MAG: HEAT repeat domain-containing protein [Gemmataceae bacterium]
MRSFRVALLLVSLLGINLLVFGRGQETKKTEAKPAKKQETDKIGTDKPLVEKKDPPKDKPDVKEEVVKDKKPAAKAKPPVAVKDKAAPKDKDGAMPAKPEEPVLSPEEQTLKSAKLQTDGPSLLEFFRKRSQLKVDRDKVIELARQLGDSDAAKRDKAYGELIALGTQALPALRQVANDLDDPEAGGMAKQCIQAMDGSAGTMITAAACHLLATSKPAGTVEVLLGYLPYAEDESIAEEIANVLNEVSAASGKPDPALLKALNDPIPMRRAYAAAVLVKVGGNEARPAVRKLLQDPKPSVRLRTALALTQFEDLDAVPALINLLGEMPQDQTKAAEEYLSQLAGEWSVTTPKGDDAVARRMRKEAWASWWKTTEGPLLIEEFKKRTLSEADREKGEALIAQLVDPSSAARDKALSDLIALGSGVVPLLRQAANKAENKAKERIQKCLEIVEKGADPSLPPVAARLLALRKPPGAAEALLAYLPSAEDESMSEEVRNALNSVAMQDGKVDPAVMKALEDKSATRRSAAAEAICRVAPADSRGAARKLLQDSDVNVRLRVARAFLGARDKEGVPTLIGLIAEVNKDQADQVFDDLFRLAEDKAPSQAFAEDKEARKKCQDAWAAWWKDNSAKVDLSKFDSADRLLGYTLIVEGWDQRNRMGKVVELDGRGKVRWKLDNLQFPTDALVISPNKIIVAEQNAQRVTARDLKNAILWQKNVNQPRGLERLPNGHIFVTGTNQLLELDRDGKEIWSHNRPGGDIMAARKFRNGQIGFVTNQGTYIRMDTTGKELKSSPTTPIQWWGGGINILNNDHVIMPLYNNGKVVEYDPTGKQIWEATFQWPTCVYRLPNGNTLVGSQQSAKTVELDKSGKVVWEAKEAFRCTMVRRR